jgi:hypothetical protein
MKNILSIFLFAALCFPLATNAATDVFFASGATGSTQISLSDACSSISGNLFVGEFSNKNRSVMIGNSGAFILLDGTNFCQNRPIFVVGSAQGINFSALKRGNAVTDISASGEIPLIDFFTGATGSVRFNITFTKSSDFTDSIIVTSHEDIQTTGGVVKIDRHSNSTTSSANVTGALTGIVAWLRLDNYLPQFSSVGIGSSNGHGIDITR